MKADNHTELFEIVAVIAIVAIVAVTAQVLLFYKSEAQSGSLLPDESGNLMSGYAITDAPVDDASLVKFLDLAVKSIDVNPPSPLIGEAFKVTAYIENNGNVEIDVPFYVEAKLTPKTLEGNLESASIPFIISQKIAPGEVVAAEFYLTTFAPEGPIQITATADSTVKLVDNNPANNQMSKTVIMTNQ